MVPSSHRLSGGCPSATLRSECRAMVDGAPVGQYVVTIDWRETIHGHGSSSGRSLMPSKYRTPKDSPLRVTIGAETNNLDPFKIP